MTFTGIQMWGMALASFNFAVLIAFEIIRGMGGKSAISVGPRYFSTIGLVCGLLMLVLGAK